MNQDGLNLGARLKHAWNAFTGRDQKMIWNQDLGPSFYSRPDRVKYHLGSERSILASIYTRIAIDVASVKIQHAQMDKNDRYSETIDSGLNYCLNTEANIDQTARAFKQDLVMSMLDDGVVAAVPVDTTYSPLDTGGYDIKTIRVGKIVDWYPRHVKINLYNDRNGLREDVTLPKDIVAIIENPLYAVMNEPISTLKRLIYKLNLLDVVDEQSSSGKLDLIIQLPYTIKTELRRQEAEKRRKDIESQLIGNKYGIAYTDGTEKVTQLNRSVENKLMEQIEYLTSMLYSQLGMTKEVFEGTADERVMLNYTSRTVEPIVSAISDEFNRKFLTKTARTKGQRVVYFYDLFKLATIDSISQSGSQLVASEILTRNEVRQLVGYKPASEEIADQLTNPNINPQTGASVPEASGYGDSSDEAADWEAEYDQGGMNSVNIADMRVADIP